MATPEDLVKKTIIKRLTAKDYWFMKVWGGSGVKKGVPDILSVINGHFVSWELKRHDGKGRITPVQKQNAVDITKNGGIAVFCSQGHTFDIVEQYILNGCSIDGLGLAENDLKLLHLNEAPHDPYDTGLYEGIWV